MVQILSHHGARGPGGPAAAWRAAAVGPEGLRLSGGPHRQRGRPASGGLSRAFGPRAMSPPSTGGVRVLAPDARSVIEIGSQSARFLTGLDRDTPPPFAVNEHCAGGTGSFFEDQMSRLGLRIEDYSALAEKAASVPRLSGRCAVFAKTDIIHRQQEGVPTPDILLGLCYAMVRNYKAVIVRSLPVEKPVALCGGVGLNAGVLRAVRDIFGLAEAELILPEHFLYAGAVGAALAAQELDTCSMGELLAALCGQASNAGDRLRRRPPLEDSPQVFVSDPPSSGAVPPEGCALGIDVGSTSTDLVLTDRSGGLVDFQYLRTAGDPEGAVRRGLETIRARFGQFPFLAVGVTGSGRERIGRLIGADAVRDEITAQAKAAVHWAPQADTVFEIGGQDSKYISLRNGQVADFQMNKICAAGTGSFVEEQAARMGIPLGEFGPLALTAEAPVELGERCTVFIETAIQSSPGPGSNSRRRWPPACASPSSATTSTRSWAASRWGGTDRPPGRRGLQPRDRGRLPPGVWGPAHRLPLFLHQRRIRRQPCWPWRRRRVPPGSTASTGQPERKPPPSRQRSSATSPSTSGGRSCCWRGTTPRRSPGRKTVGVPFALMIHKFFPMANAFFRQLGVQRAPLPAHQ